MELRYVGFGGIWKDNRRNVVLVNKFIHLVNIYKRWACCTSWGREKKAVHGLCGVSWGTSIMLGEAMRENEKIKTNIEKLK